MHTNLHTIKFFPEKHNHSHISYPCEQWVRLWLPSPDDVESRTLSRPACAPPPLSPCPAAGLPAQRSYVQKVGGPSKRPEAAGSRQLAFLPPPMPPFCPFATWWNSGQSQCNIVTSPDQIFRARPADKAAGRSRKIWCLGTRLIMAQLNMSRAQTARASRELAWECAGGYGSGRAWPGTTSWKYISLRILKSSWGFFFFFFHVQFFDAPTYSVLCSVTNIIELDRKHGNKTRLEIVLTQALPMMILSEGGGCLEASIITD